MAEMSERSWWCVQPSCRPPIVLEPEALSRGHTSNVWRLREVAHQPSIFSEIANIRGSLLDHVRHRSCSMVLWSASSVGVRLCILGGGAWKKE